MSSGPRDTRSQPWWTTWRRFWSNVLDHSVYSHHQNTMWGNIFWKYGAHDHSRTVIKTCKISAKVLWSCSDDSEWHNSLITRFMVVFYLYFQYSVGVWVCVCVGAPVSFSQQALIGGSVTCLINAFVLLHAVVQKQKRKLLEYSTRAYPSSSPQHALLPLSQTWHN